MPQLWGGLGKGGLLDKECSSGGSWSQTVCEDVLYTVLMEVKGILNSKPLGYISIDVADPDPVTPNILLMGRGMGNAALPQNCLCSNCHGAAKVPPCYSELHF